MTDEAGAHITMFYQLVSNAGICTKWVAAQPEGQTLGSLWKAGRKLITSTTAWCVSLLRVQAEQADVGKADAAWQETPDTTNSCDSSCGSAQPEAS